MGEGVDPQHEAPGAQEEEIKGAQVDVFMLDGCQGDTSGSQDDGAKEEAPSCQGEDGPSGG